MKNFYTVILVISYLLLSVILDIQAQQAGSSDYFVAQNDENASDDNPGTEELPFLTIQAAANVASAGDVVYIKEGTYRETIIPANSGTEKNPIVYRAFGNDRPVVSGTEIISGWSQHEGSIYKASMPWPFLEYERGSTNQIFVDGQMMNIARWPNNSLNQNVQSKALTTSAGRPVEAPKYPGELTGTIVSQEAPPEIDYTGTKIFFYPDTGKWTWSFTGRIESVSGNDIVFQTRNYSGEDGVYNKYADISRFWLFDALELLDAPGEYYHDKNTGELFLWVPNGDDPSNYLIEAKKRDFAFDLSNKSHIELKGLRIFGATVTMDNIAGIKGGTYDEYGFNTNQYPWRGKASVASAHHIVLDGLDVLYPTHSLNQEGHAFMQHGQSSGIVLGGYDHVVKNCHIQYASDNGISCLGHRHKIINNVIENINYYARIHSAVAFGGSGTESYDHEIAYNTIRRTGRSGIVDHNLKDSDLSDLSVPRIHHNDISEYMLQDNDGAGIRITGHGESIIRVDHNYVHNGNNKYINSCYYTDFARNVIFDHNIGTGMWSTIHLNGWWLGDDADHSSNILVYNNTVICQNNPNTDSYISGPFNFSGGKEKNNVVIKNNIMVYHEPPAKGNHRTYQNATHYEPAEKSNNLNGIHAEDVHFEDYTHGDFRLTSTSDNAIDKGVEIDTYTFKESDGTFIFPPFNEPHNGSAPDLGAIEYGMPMFKVGASETTHVITIHSENGKTNIQSGSEIPEGAEISISVKGNAGYAFTHWTGDVPAGNENDNPLFITIDAAKNITANYTEVSTFALTVENDGFGNANVSPQSESYNKGDVVSIIPQPNPTYELDKWTGDVPVSQQTDNPLELVMDADKTITATFKKRDLWYDLTSTSYSNRFTGTTHSNDEIEWLNNGDWTGITFSQNNSLTITNAGKKWSDIKNEFKATTIDISSNPVLTFSLKSDKTYTYNVRIDDVNGSWGNSSKEIEIQGDNQFHQYTVDFSGSGGVDMTKIKRIVWWFGGQDDDLGTWVIESLTLGDNDIPVSNYTLSTATSGSGVVSLSPDGGTYDEGTIVTATATPDDGNEFSNWSGDANGTTNPITVTMDGDKSITANYKEIVQEKTYTLQIESEGKGSTSANPEKTEYTENESVQITATPDEGYTFESWTGDVDDADKNKSTFDLMMDSDKNLTAQFVKIPEETFLLTINEDENGTVDKSPDQEEYTENQTVILTAKPKDGYLFTKWTGDVSADDEAVNPLTLTMDTDKTISAGFRQIMYSLTIGETLHGSVTTEPEKDEYPAGETVKLMSVPDEGYTFHSWVGDIPEEDKTNSEVTLIMDADKMLIPQFTESDDNIGIADNPDAGMFIGYKRNGDISVHFKNITAPQQVSLYSVQGVCLMNKLISDNMFVIKKGDLNSGIYILRATGKRKSFVSKFVAP